ncbi:ubiquitin fusion degradation protein UFD1-domain-containing protein [Sporodiniella umbellata]|nr:ubiquitin fusion degradation protein UFD1-domain-containing protein [Sporodiniella umbellata]
MFNDDDGFSNSFLGGFRSNFGIVNPNRTFSENYRCYPIAMMQHGNDRDNVNYGGKIILPQSALEKLSQLNISYPMLFKIVADKRHTHAGVLEFIAEEGRVYLPQWMMETLGTEPGSIIQVKNVTLPLGSFVKIQPQSTDFLDITDHRAVLEKALRNFSTLTVDDVVQINYNDRVYEIKILEVKPLFEEHSGISIVETDLEVDFAPPVGYVEPTKAPQQRSQMPIELPQPSKKSFSAFQGGGTSLRGKSKAIEDESAIDKDEQDNGPLILPFGQLYFGFPIVPPPSDKNDEDEKTKHNFTGAGQTLRTKKK